MLNGSPRLSFGLGRAGPGWALAWAGLGWTGLGWAGLGCAGLWAGPGWALGWAGLWAALGFVLGWALGWAEPGFGLGRVGLWAGLGRGLGRAQKALVWQFGAWQPCKAKADWQLNFRISFAGRLTKCHQPSFEYRGKPKYSYALGRVPYMGDGRSLGGQTTTGDYIYTRTRPFCCLTADSAAPPVGVCGPPFGDFRARARPLRQEPEWQLNDLDVAVCN